MSIAFPRLYLFYVSEENYEYKNGRLKRGINAHGLIRAYVGADNIYGNGFITRSVIAKFYNIERTYCNNIVGVVLNLPVERSNTPVKKGLNYKDTVPVCVYCSDGFYEVLKSQSNRLRVVQDDKRCTIDIRIDITEKPRNSSVNPLKSIWRVFSETSEFGSSRKNTQLQQYHNPDAGYRALSTHLITSVDDCTFNELEQIKMSIINELELETENMNRKSQTEAIKEEINYIRYLLSSWSKRRNT